MSDSSVGDSVIVEVHVNSGNSVSVRGSIKTIHVHTLSQITGC